MKYDLIIRQKNVVFSKCIYIFTKRTTERNYEGG